MDFRESFLMLSQLIYAVNIWTIQGISYAWSEKHTDNFRDILCLLPIYKFTIEEINYYSHFIMNRGHEQVYAIVRLSTILKTLTA